MAIRNRPNCSGLHRPLGDQLADLGVERAVAARGVRSSPGSPGAAFPAVARSTIGMNCMILRFQLVPEEVVDLQGVIGVGGMDRAQDVNVDRVLLQDLPAAHHLLEGAGAALVDPVGIVHAAAGRPRSGRPGNYAA